MKVTELVADMARPIVEARGCELWDVEYVREGSERFLRIYLDKDGGVGIEDCEAVARAMDPLLDEADPIPERYHFEVCSTGLERPLRRPSDFQKFLGSPIWVKLYRPMEGRKEFPAALEEYDDGRVTVMTQDGQRLTLEKSQVALIRLRAEF